MSDEPTSGVILAGGRSRRLGGGPKALRALDDRTLLDHVIERFRPQVGALRLSVERQSDDFLRFGLSQLSDPVPGFHGPLGGLLASLEAAGDAVTFVALAPCDAPFLPRDLVARLRQRASKAGAEAVVARYGGVAQPTFSLWRRTLLDRLRNAVLAERIGGFMAFLDRIEWTAVDWPAAEPSPFFNVNDPDDLAAARDILEKSGKEITC
jgi:molybdopterin-guanine dinucleotide biosynthesis protein A